MRTITPSFFTSYHGQIAPTYDSIELGPMFILLNSSLWINFCKITYLPDFTPTPYMLEKYAEHGDEPWENVYRTKEIVIEFTNNATSNSSDAMQIGSVKEKESEE